MSHATASCRATDATVGAASAPASRRKKAVAFWLVTALTIPGLCLWSRGASAWSPPVRTGWGLASSPRSGESGGCGGSEPRLSHVQASLLRKLERDLEPFGCITRRGILATAARKSPWTLTVQIREGELWAAPSPLPGGLDPYLQPGQGSFMTTYVAAILSSMMMTLHHYPGAVPDVTLVFLPVDNCMFVWGDRNFLVDEATGLENTTWGDWGTAASAGTCSYELGPTAAALARRGPGAGYAPSLSYQDFRAEGSSQQCWGLAYPSYDWIFIGQDYSDSSRDKRDGLSEVPWAARQPMLVFRGTGWGLDSAVSPFDPHPQYRPLRRRVAEAAAAHPDTMDVKLLECHDAPCSPDIEGGRLPWEEQFKYKYALDVDGWGGTLRLKFLLLSGSLVFKLDSPSAQYWVTELRPWVHYIPVSWHLPESDLPRKVRWAIEHDAEAEAIMLAGRAWALEHLTDAGAAWYQRQALAAIARRQGGAFPPIPGSARFCCDHLETAEDGEKPGDAAYYLAKCLEWAPAHLRRCAASPNAYEVARFGLEGRGQPAARSELGERLPAADGAPD